MGGAALVFVVIAFAVALVAGILSFARRLQARELATLEAEGVQLRSGPRTIALRLVGRDDEVVIIFRRE